MDFTINNRSSLKQKTKNPGKVCNSMTTLFIVVVFCLNPKINAFPDNNDGITTLSDSKDGHRTMTDNMKIYPYTDKTNREVKDALSFLADPYLQSVMDMLRQNYGFNFPSAFEFDKLDQFGNGTKTSPCVRDLRRLFESLTANKTQSWGFQFFDASGKLGASLAELRIHWVGNSEQCRTAVAPPSIDDNGTTINPGFTGNYCVADIGVQMIPLPIRWGGCYPNTCSSGEIEVVLASLVRKLKTHTVSVLDVRCVLPDKEITAATVTAIVILAVTGFLAILGTLYDIFCTQIKKEQPFEKMINENEGEPATSATSEAPPETIMKSGTADESTVTIQNISVINPSRRSKNIIARILLAFSFYTNGKKVLDTSQASSSLRAINGIRFLSMSWVVLGHVFIYGINYTSNELFGVQRYFRRKSFAPIGNAFCSVDTFFAMSGLLLSYLTIKELRRKGVGINWAMFYFHRFWRLTPPYMFVLVVILGLQKFMYTNHFSIKETPHDHANCEKNWWTNLIYVNNLVNSEDLCMPQSWYLANDIQFFVVSPLLIIPFYFHWAAGVMSCIVFLLVSWITTGVLSTQEHWGTSVQTMNSNHWTEHYYYAPWCRIGPYVIGILAGFILANTKGKDKPIRMPWWAVTSCWIISTVTALSVLYGLFGDISGKDPSSNTVSALYNSISRTAWGGCVCWVIVACSAGYGGPINKFLSWSPFVVLGRLTYMTYLIHICIINVYFGGMGSLYYLNDATVVVNFLGILVFSNLAAFFFMLLLESPMIGLERAFLRKDRKDR